jgi:hypothetical protein
MYMVQSWYFAFLQSSFTHLTNEHHLPSHPHRPSVVPGVPDALRGARRPLKRRPRRVCARVHGFKWPKHILVSRQKTSVERNRKH